MIQICDVCNCALPHAGVAGSRKRCTCGATWELRVDAIPVGRTSGTMAGRSMRALVWVRLRAPVDERPDEAPAPGSAPAGGGDALEVLEGGVVVRAPRDFAAEVCDPMGQPLNRRGDR